MLEIKIGDLRMSQIILLSPQLFTDAILGLDFLVEYYAVINVAEKSITLEINGERNKIEFIGIREMTNESGSVEDSSSENKFRKYGLVSGVPRELLLLPAEPGQYPNDPTVEVDDDTLV
jgi:hypothetical protein